MGSRILYEDSAEKLVRALVVGLMNGQLYFTEHRRVVEASEEAVEALDAYFEMKPRLILGVREGLFVFEGRQLYDLSIYAHRLIKSIRGHGGWGLCLERGVTAEEIRRLIALLLELDNDSVEESNSKLERLGVTRVALEQRAVTDRLITESDASTQAAQALSDQQISRDVYTGTLNVLQDLMVDLHRNKQISFAAANDMAENLARALRANPASFIVLTAVKDYDAFTFNHSVNICIYTTSLAERLTTKTDEIVRIAQAALLHDVGKLLVQDEILYKRGRLTPEEWEVMREHPFLGAKILMEAKGGQELAVNVAYGHHLRYDRTGYPELKGEMEVDPVTDLVNLIDVYEALTAQRPYKNPVTPEKAAEILLKGSGTQFSPLAVEMFIETFGIYPPGTRVRLSDGTRGVVFQANPERPFQPKVRRTHGPDDELLDSEEEVDTAEEKASGTPRRSIVESIL